MATTAYMPTARTEHEREAFAKALELNPNRIWVKQQLDKTPTK